MMLLQSVRPHGDSEFWSFQSEIIKRYVPPVASSKFAISVCLLFDASQRMSTSPNSQDADSHEHYDIKDECEADVPVDIYSEDRFPGGGLRVWLLIWV